MKNIFIVSSVIFIIMTMLLVTDKIDFNNTVSETIEKGNKFYEIQAYEKAKDIYMKGLESDLNDPIIHHNIGLSEYLLGNYEEAIEQFMLTDKDYILIGNSYYRQGIDVQDINQKINYYEQSLNQYKEGIKFDPENLELKYNYEYVKKLIEDLNKEIEKNNNEQKKQENNEDNKNDKSQGNQNEKNDSENENQKNLNEENDSEDKSQENKNGKNDSEDEKQGNQNENNNLDNNSQENKEQNNSKNEESQSNNNNLNNQSNNSSTNNDNTSNEIQDNKNKNSNSNEDDKINGVINQEVEENKLDESTIYQVLKQLEQQEKESLKNNHSVIRQGKEEEYDW